MTALDKTLVVEAAYWYFQYSRLSEGEDFSPLELLLDICDNVGLELEDSELDDLVEEFENR